MRARKKELGDWHKTEMKIENQNAATTLWTEYESEEQQLVKQRKHMAVLSNDHILTFGEVFEISLTSSNSFNIRFAILLTLLTLRCS